MALPLVALVFAMLLGLGLHRHAAPLAVSTAATVLTMGPALIAVGASRRRRALLLPAVLGGWAAALLLVLPVYFPGERRQAVATGLSLVGLGNDWERVARAVAEQLPQEPQLAEPELPEALAILTPVEPAPLPLEQHQIALPFEGEGRRLSVPVVFENEFRSLETQMMLDTGATYTTLPTEFLTRLGAAPEPDAPVITLHTANGERNAKMVLIDRIWLGDQAIDNVAIAVCDECGSSGNIGLLGLNVAGGFNVLIDADRREVVFSARAGHDRQLDVAPFVDLSARFLRYPGGRVEVAVSVVNLGVRTVGRVQARVSCGDERWLVEVDQIAGGETVNRRSRLPEHAACDGYRVGLESAWW